MCVPFNPAAGSTVVLSFYAAEALAAHAAMDAAQVPRTQDGELLSLAQRVELLAGAYKSACGALGR